MSKRNLVILAIFAAFAYFIVRSFNSMAEPQQLHLPRDLTGIPAASVRSDDPDVARIGQIKPSDSKVFQEATSIYGDGNNKTVLWVGVVKNADEATRFLRKAGPALNNLPGLSGARELNLMGRPSWIAQGDGMSHIIFTDQQMVLYLASRISNTMPMVQQILQHPLRPSGF